MVKYLSFHNSSFALRYFLMQMARLQCDTPLVYNHYLSKISELKNQVLNQDLKFNSLFDSLLPNPMGE
jgi:hypothetical protein